MCKLSPKDIDICSWYIIIKSWHALKFENMSHEISYQLFINPKLLWKNNKKCLASYTSITGRVVTSSTSIQHVPKNFRLFSHFMFLFILIPGINLWLILLCSFLRTLFQNMNIQNTLSKWEMKSQIKLRNLRTI